MIDWLEYKLNGYIVRIARIDELSSRLDDIPQSYLNDKLQRTCVALCMSHHDCDYMRMLLQTVFLFETAPFSSATTSILHVRDHHIVVRFGT